MDAGGGLNRWIVAQTITSCEEDAVFVLQAYDNVLCRMSDAASSEGSARCPLPVFPWISRRLCTACSGRMGCCNGLFLETSVNVLFSSLARLPPSPLVIPSCSSPSTMYARCHHALPLLVECKRKSAPGAMCFCIVFLAQNFGCGVRGRQASRGQAHKQKSSRLASLRHPSRRGGV